MLTVVVHTGVDCVEREDGTVVVTPEAFDGTLMVVGVAGEDVTTGVAGTTVATLWAREVTRAIFATAVWAALVVWASAVPPVVTATPRKDAIEAVAITAAAHMRRRLEAIGVVVVICAVPLQTKRCSC